MAVSHQTKVGDKPWFVEDRMILSCGFPMIIVKVLGSILVGERTTIEIARVFFFEERSPFLESTLEDEHKISQRANLSFFRVEFYQRSFTRS